MPCPHFDMKIVQRSENESAVAAAAYQSGEKLYSQYDNRRNCIRIVLFLKVSFNCFFIMIILLRIYSSSSFLPVISRNTVSRSGSDEWMVSTSSARSSSQIL